MANGKRSTQHHRPYQTRELALGSLTVNPNAQRELKKHRVDYLLANLDLNMIGELVVSWRDGKYYVLDGQHRADALRQFLGNGWEIQKIMCRVYQGLSEADEADMFDRLNDSLRVDSFDKFRARVHAKRDVEVAIDKIIRANGFHLAKAKAPGAIGCTSTLVTVFTRSNGEILAQALRVIRDAFGDAGCDKHLINGLALVCQRYSGVLDEKLMVERLRSMRAGSKGLLGNATLIQRTMGTSLPVCVAAAVVEAINAQRGGQRIPSWWKMAAQSQEETPAKAKITW